MFLEEIAALKREEVEKRKSLSPLSRIKTEFPAVPPPLDFLEAIRRQPPPALIAEIKEASPSAGVIRSDVDRSWLAERYEAGGARAISVLTETRYFRGALAHLRQVRRRTSLPLLMKDFVVDPYQIYEGRGAGADAILLIAALLERRQLAEFVRACRELKMMPLVEVHTEEDLGRISGLELPLIGINNRDLKTLKVDLETTFRLLEKIPKETTVISESGIRTGEDVRRMQAAGVAGVLVGEALMRAADPALHIKEFMGKGGPAGT
jgi:indole-3-glycerol phosphate synthase